MPVAVQTLVPRTPFLERNGSGPYTLGNPRWQTVPARPTRKRAQDVTTGGLRAKAAILLGEYRLQQGIKAANDITGRRDAISRLEFDRRFPEAEAVRREIEACDHGKFLDADSELRTLEAEAAALVMPVLDELILSFDAELHEVAAQKEAELEKYGLPLFQEIPNQSAVHSINAPAPPQYLKVWVLWNDDICTQLHSCREVVRNLRQKFDAFSTYSRGEINAMLAIPTTQFLLSDEDCDFSWL
jgi:hypothetical protein